MSLLAIFEILGLLFKILIPDDKYSLRNSQNLRRQLQMQLSKKQRKMLNFLLQF